MPAVILADQCAALLASIVTDTDLEDGSRLLARRMGGGIFKVTIGVPDTEATTFTVCVTKDFVPLGQSTRILPRKED